jgi:hypothetical protein
MGADFEGLAAGLRAGTRGSDPHVRAAVELLIGQGEHWLNREDFRVAAIGGNGMLGGELAEARVRWDEARQFLAGPGMTASTSQRAILDIAIAIGSNSYRLSRMDDEQARAIVKAFADALNVEVIIGD